MNKGVMTIVLAFFIVMFALSFLRQNNEKDNANALVEAIRENSYVECQQMVTPSAKAVSLCETLGRYVHTSK